MLAVLPGTEAGELQGMQLGGIKSRLGFFRSSLRSTSQKYF